MAILRLSFRAVLIWVSAIVAVLVTGVAITALANLNKTDVAAYHRHHHLVAPPDIKAGDLVWVAGNGRAFGWICSFTPEESAREIIGRTPLVGWYENAFGHYVPSMPGLGGDDAHEGEEIAADSIPFSGQISTLSDRHPRRFREPNCECKLARAILNRQSICVAESEIVEDPPGSLRAIAFKVDTVFLSQAAFEACGLEVPDRVAEGGSCPIVGNLPWAAWLRSRLGLIEQSARGTHASLAEAALDGR